MIQNKFQNFLVNVSIKEVKPIEKKKTLQERLGCKLPTKNQYARNMVDFDFVSSWAECAKEATLKNEVEYIDYLQSDVGDTELESDNTDHDNKKRKRTISLEKTEQKSTSLLKRVLSKEPVNNDIPKIEEETMSIESKKTKSSEGEVSSEDDNIQVQVAPEPVKPVVSPEKVEKINKPLPKKMKIDFKNAANEAFQASIDMIEKLKAQQKAETALKNTVIPVVPKDTDCTMEPTAAC